MTASQHKHRIRIGLAGMALAGLVALALLLAKDGSSTANASGPNSATSVVILSGDGMGIQQRTAIQYATYGLEKRQPMDALPYTGFLDTISLGKGAVTDSSAGATAWSIGQKTWNGYTGMAPDKTRPQTLTQLASSLGKSTGLVNDHDITNATLASFGAQVLNRDAKVKIAYRELVKNHVDVMMGGCECYWYPKGNEGKIPNKVPDEDKSWGKKNLIKKAKEMGYSYAWDKDSLAKLTGPKALAVVQDSPKQRWKELKGYKYKKDPYYVPEADMLSKAMEILGQNPKGFFLVAESDDLDSAGHEHDGRGVIQNGRTMNQMVEAVNEYRKTNPNVLLIVTADHETGGMTIEDVGEKNTDSDGDDPVPYWGSGKKNNAGPKGQTPPRSGPFKIKGTGRKFKVDWTTPEHTGGMVPVTAIGPLAEQLVGVHENTYVHDVVSRALRGQP